MRISSLAVGVASLLGLAGCVTQAPIPAEVVELTSPNDTNGATITTLPSSASSEGSPQVAPSEVLTPDSTTGGTLTTQGGLLPPDGAPIVAGAGQYLVKKDDTLYSIAKNFDVSVAYVAERNDISPPYKIRPGDILTIKGDLPYYKVPSFYDHTPGGWGRPHTSLKAGSAKGGEKTSVATSSSTYRFPLSRGKILYKFGQAKNNPFNKSLIIENAGGSNEVFAAADGFVAYAGNTIKGYGTLVLIEHGENLMTAYGFLSGIKVHVGDTVAKGDVIGVLGQVPDVQNPSLLFQFRKKSKPVDPLQFVHP